MEKIQTLFNRNAAFKVEDTVREGCEWVLSGEGVATEKLDGTNVRLTIRTGTLVRLEKRRNPSKLQKKQGIKEPWYVDADESDPGDKYLFEAAAQTDVSEWPDGEHSCEALGPKVQGNPLGLEGHLCHPFALQPVVLDVPNRSFAALKGLLPSLQSAYSPGHAAEGIVFHHPDGRMVKIKRKDFA